jgi:ferrous iron transport protein A
VGIIVGISDMGHMELASAPCNQMLGVMNVGSDANWEKRFESMGIRKGGYIRKIANQPFGGPVVIEVNGSKISLSRNIAAKIEVEVVAVSPH